MAGYDDARGRVIYQTWLLRTLILAYIETVLKPEAHRGWELSLTLWTIRNAFGGKEKPPIVPLILQD